MSRSANGTCGGADRGGVGGPGCEELCDPWACEPPFFPPLPVSSGSTTGL